MDKRPIEDIFNECYEKMLAGMPAEEIIRQYPNHAKELKELLGVAQSVSHTPPVRVSDQKLFSCLIKVGEEIQRQKERSLSSKLNRLFVFASPAWARGFALTLVIVFAAWGTVNASANSLPGSPLYLVKLLGEKASYFLTVNPQGQLELKITFSERRSKELIKEFNKTGHVDIQTLKRMLNEAGDSLNEVAKLPVKGQKIYLVQLKYLNDYQKDVLQDLQSRAPQVQKAKLEQAITICNQRCRWLQMACDRGCVTSMRGCPCPLPSKNI
ncbi:MAG: hypothetical protein KGJ95_02215 [Candidatus Omnitrophica bacterium]|nr:hypothetical protein [Candidatus Omnitrophota bacterium]MDE2230870.1 hypothetical protein [Candidatus Omnitrophota bacterium]